MASKEIKNVIHNSTYLFITQGVAYIAPLLILGHLIKTLGIEGFGLYALCLSIAAYLQVIVDYGFAFSASRQISQNRNDKKYISRVYWATIIIKITIFLIILPLYLYAINIFIVDEGMSKALLATYFLTLGNTIFPVWFYQGIEKLKIIAILNLLSRLTSCVLVILMVKNIDDVALSLFLQAFPVIIGGVIANFNILYKKYIFFTRPTVKDISKSFIEGWEIFVATLASTILTNSAVFILGVYTTPAVVGFYAAVERIVKAVVSLFGPLTQSLYPYNCKKFSVSFSDGLSSVKKTGKPLVILAIFVSVFLLLGWEMVANWLKLPHGSYYIACILVVWLFFSVINNILGIQILSASGYAKLYSRAFLLSALLTLFLLFVLVQNMTSFGAAISMTIGEIILFFMLLIKVNKLRILLLMIKD